MKTGFIALVSVAVSAGLFGFGDAFAGSAHGADKTVPPVSFVTQTVKEENAEGPGVERMYFTAGSKRIVYGLPKKCKITPDGDGILLDLSATGINGQIRVSNSSLPVDLELTANALQYRDAGAKTLPKGATKVEVQQPELNTYPYNGWKSLGFTWTYEFYGRSLLQTVNYIDLDIGRQVVVYTQADQADAEKVGKIAKQFMSSWWVMKDRSNG